MTHPSSLAVDYIWERFLEVAFGDKEQELIAQIERIRRAAEHRPFNPRSDSHRKFCAKMLGEIDNLYRKYPDIDFSKEIEEFKGWDIS